MARRVRRARGTISWRPERKAYFVRWVAPDGTRKQLRGGKTIPEAQAVLDAIFEDERRDAGGEPVERLLHEFLADEHLPALMARLAPKVFLTRKSRLLAVAKLLGTKPMREVRRVDAERLGLRAGDAVLREAEEEGQEAPGRRVTTYASPSVPGRGRLRLRSPLADVLLREVPISVRRAGATWRPPNK